MAKSSSPVKFILANRIGQDVVKERDYLPAAANKTQPDQSFTLQELLEGFVVGRVPNVARNVDYDYDPETVGGQQIAMMSLSEAEAYANIIHDKVKAAKERHANLLAQIERQKQQQQQEFEDLKAKVTASASSAS